MPYYDYHCLDCDETFEVRASIREKEAGLSPGCPRCGTSSVEQRITGAALLGSRHSVLQALRGGGNCGSAGPGAGCCG